jgi:hypothetical protein
MKDGKWSFSVHGFRFSDRVVDRGFGETPHLSYIHMYLRCQQALVLPGKNNNLLAFAGFDTLPIGICYRKFYILNGSVGFQRSFCPDSLYRKYNKCYTETQSRKPSGQFHWFSTYQKGGQAWPGRYKPGFIILMTIVVSLFPSRAPLA